MTAENIIRRAAIILVWAAVVFAADSPCFAWIYNGATTPGSGPLVADGTSTVWVAAPFMLDSDAYATSFAIAASRAYGPADAGFDVWLGESVVGLPGSALATWTVIPLTAVMTYYDTPLATPVFLRANTPYFAVISPNRGDFAGGVSYSMSGYYAYASADYGITWRQLARPIGLRVDGYFVPEPCSAAALLAGLSAFGVTIRRRL